MAANEDVDLSLAALHLETPDGRSFVVRGPVSQRPRVGEYLELDTVHGPLAFVEEVLSDPAGAGFVASGSLVGETASASGERARWAEAPLRPTRDAAVQALLSGPDPQLHLGQLVDHAEVGVALIPSRLNRHTFWCGQSGSGKTHALGVLLERILLNTRLPMVVFDPNSDFVGLGEVNAGVDSKSVAALASRDIVVLRPGDERSPLHVLFKEMTPRARAAVLRLDPVIDRSEYNTLLGLMDALDSVETPDIVGHLHSLGDPDATALAQRLQNLGVLEWTTTWAYGAESATSVIARRPDATVLDLGGYDRNEEQLTVTLAVLDDLWARRNERQPLLLVIDEAHNLCPPEPETPLGVAVRDRIIQIAAEGRKYGLWLLLSTQRPSKVHPGIVSQCDNLTLMRMNSRDDLDQLSAIFGFVPRGLLARAARFHQGEALVAGGFVTMPSIVRMRGRVTPEGGIDVPVPMP
jgi:uncharacterized protein